MKHSTIFFVCLISIMNPLYTSENDPYNKTNIFSEHNSLFKRLHTNNFFIKKIAGNYVLAKQKNATHDRLIVQNFNASNPHIVVDNKKIKIYSGGTSGFAWKLSESNDFFVFNCNDNTYFQCIISETDTMYDVVVNNKGIYVYGFDFKKEKDFIGLVKKRKNYFLAQSSCTLLDDSYIRYVSNNKKYSLIEALPCYSPSLLVKQHPTYEILGIFKSLYSNKHIAMSHDGQKYAIYTNPHFMLHDYAKEKDTLYKLQLTKNSKLERLVFSDSDDVVLAHYDDKLIIISFEENKHWKIALPELRNIFPCSVLKKTIIQLIGGVFGYLSYNDEHDTFEVISFEQ